MLICSSQYFVLRLWITLYAEKLYSFSCLCQSSWYYERITLTNKAGQLTPFPIILGYKIQKMPLSTSSTSLYSCHSNFMRESAAPILLEFRFEFTFSFLHFSFLVMLVPVFAATFVPHMLQNLLKYMHI